MKILKLTSFAIVTMLTLAACSKEEVTTTKGQVDIRTSIVSTPAVETRATFDPSGDGSGTFDDDDVIKLVIYGGNPFPVNIEYSKNKPLSWEDIKTHAGEAATYTFCGWYNTDPVALDRLNPTFNAATATDPDLLLATPDTVAEGATVNLPFHHAMHQLIINLTGDIVNLGITSEQFFASKVSLLNMNATAVVDVKTGTVTPGEATDADGDYGSKTDAYDFIIAPQKVATGTDWIKIELADMTFVYKMPATLKDGTPLTLLESGKRLALMLTLKKSPTGQTDVVLSDSGISAWGTQGTIDDTVDVGGGGNTPVSGDINMTGKSVDEVKAAIQTALAAGITEFCLTGPIANSGMDGTNQGSPFSATNITKIDLTGVTGWAAVECDGYNLTTETEIGLPAFAFRECSSLTEVKLPAEVKAIGAFAFECCSSLTTINLGSVTHVGNGAFGSCEALANVSLAEATTLYAGAFANTAFVSIYLPKVTAISVVPNANTSFWGSFKQCAQLTAVSAPLLTDIGNNTFSGCTKLKTIDIPNAATIGETAFQRCESLESITFDKVTTIGKQAFAFCPAVTTVDLPLAEEIGERAFWNCTALTEIALPKAALINLCAFSACTELKTLRLPAAKKIGNYIADGCSKLTLIEVTAAGELTSSSGTDLNTSGPFINTMTTPPFTSTTSALVLNTDKKAGGTGVPLASGNTWTNVTWKSITYQ